MRAPTLALLEGDIAALQQAILAGEDPTVDFEAPAAGGNGLSSSIGGYAIIQYDNTSVLARAGFETAYEPLAPEVAVEDDSVIVPPGGGEAISLSITEGDLNPLNGESLIRKPLPRKLMLRQEPCR